MNSRLEAGLKIVRSLASLSLAAIALTGCTPVNEEAQVTPVDYKACLATSETAIETGSIADQSLEGIQRAVLNKGVAYKVLNARTDATTISYISQLKNLVRSDCNLIVAVSHRMSVATYRVAKANPKVNFVLVDAALTTSNKTPASMPNVRELRFDAHSAAFLAGYLAASASKTQTVGALGGANVKQVTDVLAGFKLGVTRFNEQNNAEVEVIGAAGDYPSRWKFTSTWASGEEQTALAYKLADAGADVIFAYSGSTTLGLNPAGGAALGSPAFIGVDSDWFNLAQNSDVAPALLASITKSIAPAVEGSIAAGLSGKFAGGQSGAYLGTLTNAGVALTEQHTLAYPTGVAAALEDLKAEIIAGTLVVDSGLNNK
jgi:basic membrane protein A